MASCQGNFSCWYCHSCSTVFGIRTGLCATATAHMLKESTQLLSFFVLVCAQRSVCTWGSLHLGHLPWLAGSSCWLTPRACLGLYQCKYSLRLHDWQANRVLLSQFLLRGELGPLDRGELGPFALHLCQHVCLLCFTCAGSSPLILASRATLHCLLVLVVLVAPDLLLAAAAAACRSACQAQGGGSGCG